MMISLPKILENWLLTLPNIRIDGVNENYLDISIDNKITKYVVSTFESYQIRRLEFEFYPDKNIIEIFIYDGSIPIEEFIPNYHIIQVSDPEMFNKIEKIINDNR